MSIKATDFFKKTNLNFGKLLFSLRKCEEMSQIELAKKLGVSRGYICDIEKGRKQAPISLVVKISKVLALPKEGLIQQLFNDQLKSAKLKLTAKVEAS